MKACRICHEEIAAIATKADQALHAGRLRFYHPRLRQTISAEAPLPPDFEKTLAALRKHRG